MERRTFLVLGAAVVGLAGCTRGAVEPGPPSGPAPSTAPTDPDSRVREAVAASEVALIGAYRAAITASPGLAPDLERFLAHHERHLARIAPEFDTSAGSPNPSASGSEGAAADTLAALAAAETEAQAQRERACDGAQDPTLARELCLIAASEAQHAVALGALADGESGS